MSEHSQSVREYLRATEVLLNTDELTDVEIQVIAEILHRLSEKLLNHRGMSK